LQLAPAGDEAGGLTLIQAYDAAYSPDGQQIVFTGRVSQVKVQDAATVTVEFEELFIAPAAGGQIQRLTTLEADNAKGAFWSPDGEQIVFASDVDGDFDIYLVSVNGGQPWAITFNNADDRQPAWSPDGLTIAFASDQGGPGFLEVWSMTADSANLKQLTDDANNSYAPAWSPDGYYIAFVSDRRVDTDLYVMNADGTGERLLTLSDDRFEERDPAWSPDGSWIAFSSNRGGALFDLYLIRPDGSDLQQVTVDRGENRYVTWMP
jgi:dipeptidyl aminopeptidase/acylaminoacyl peptidase